MLPETIPLINRSDLFNESRAHLPLSLTSVLYQDAWYTPNQIFEDL